jgi:hypothetical protein
MPMVATMGEASNEIPPRPAHNPKGPGDFRPRLCCSSLEYHLIHFAPRALPGTKIAHGRAHARVIQRFLELRA